MTEDRIYIPERLGGIDIDGTLPIEDFINHVASFKEMHKEYRNIRIVENYGSLYVYGDREETDDEYNKRMNVLFKNNKLREERERKLLDKLKAKYD